MVEATNQQGYEVQVKVAGQPWKTSTVNEEGKIYTKEQANALMAFSLIECALRFTGDEYRVYPKLT